MAIKEWLKRCVVLLLQTPSLSPHFSPGSSADRGDFHIQGKRTSGEVAAGTGGNHGLQYTQGEDIKLYVRYNVCMLILYMCVHVH